MESECRAAKDGDSGGHQINMPGSCRAFITTLLIRGFCALAFVRMQRETARRPGFRTQASNNQRIAGAPLPIGQMRSLPGCRFSDWARLRD